MPCEPVYKSFNSPAPLVNKLPKVTVIPVLAQAHNVIEFPDEDLEM